MIHSLSTALVCIFTFRLSDFSCHSWYLVPSGHHKIHKIIGNAKWIRQLDDKHFSARAQCEKLSQRLSLKITVLFLALLLNLPSSKHHVHSATACTKSTEVPGRCRCHKGVVGAGSAEYVPTLVCTVYSGGEQQDVVMVVTTGSDFNWWRPSLLWNEPAWVFKNRIFIDKIGQNWQLK